MAPTAHYRRAEPNRNQCACGEDFTADHLADVRDTAAPMNRAIGHAHAMLALARRDHVAAERIAPARQQVAAQYIVTTDVHGGPFPYRLEQRGHGIIDRYRTSSGADHAARMAAAGAPISPHALTGCRVGTPSWS